MSGIKPQLSYPYRTVIFTLMILFLFSFDSFAGGKMGIYGIRMVPNGEDAEDYSRPGYGLGLHLVAPVPQIFNLFAASVGFEGLNLLSETVSFQDDVTLLTVEQQTSQNYFRFFIGGRIGGHGRGFIRPHIGLNLALVFYGIDTDVVIPDDSDRENEIRQNLSGENHMVFGYDINMGVDLNFWNKWNLEGGVKYLKSFSLPQQLGEGSEKIHPEYFQIYIGVGISFRLIRGAGE